MKYAKTNHISFPLGGIGTGCINLAGNGALLDWEIFNRPNKNTVNGCSHFAIKAICKDKVIAKVLHGDTAEDYAGMPHVGLINMGFGHGARKETLAGFPHFRKVDFDGEFPFANLTFEDEDFPALVRLCAFNPFIPHDAFHSSLPAAFFEWEIENTADETVEYVLALSVKNPFGTSLHKAVEKGCVITCADKEKTERDYCDLTLLTDGESMSVQEYWKRVGWMEGDGIEKFWREFSLRAPLSARSYTEPLFGDYATVSTTVVLPAKAKKRVRFILAWNVPNQYNYWHTWSGFAEQKGLDITWKNYYATQFENSFATAKYALSNFDSLLERTKRFTDALYGCSLPDFALDAVGANLSVLKSPTVLRLEDGSLWGWEGVNESIGSCEGSCQHVWNYAYALPFLFPELERSLRENNLKYAFKESGQTSFRVRLPLGKAGEGTSRACVDGQMGEVIKCYREWKLSGDTEWLKAHAEPVFKMLEFAWSKDNADGWDADQDGVMEGRQHHTLDVELFGPNSWLEGFYLLALDCGVKMATALGQTQRAKTYQRLYEQGKAWTNEHLFNDEYFGQKLDLTDKAVVEKFSASDFYWDEESGEIKYQIGEGCIIDQMLADWHCAILGLDGVFDGDKKHKALSSLYQYNYKPTMRDVVNTWRNFALNDEGGTLICAYPAHKNRPETPILYNSETMTGFEYALGGLMLAEGFTAEGETLLKAVRARYNGEHRNPFSEIECGNHYARSMASYALMAIYSGFSFDMTENYIGFQPIIGGDGQYLWSVATAYGTMKFQGDKAIFSVFEKGLELSSFGLKDEKTVACVCIDGREIPFTQQGNRLFFAKQTVGRGLEIFF